MSKDLLVLADEYAAATATFARALALKDSADSMSPIAREAGDKRAVLAEALAALDAAQPVQVNAMLAEALEQEDALLRELSIHTNAWYAPIFAKTQAALTAAKQAQPEPAYTQVGEDGEGQEKHCPDCGAEPGQMCSSVEGVEWGRRVHVARQQAQPERAPSDADCDRAYRNGLKAGFSFGLEGNEEGFRKSMESYQREIVAHGIKQGGQP